MTGIKKISILLGISMFFFLSISISAFNQTISSNKEPLPIENTSSDDFEPFDENQTENADEFQEFAQDSVKACPSDCSGCDSKKKDNSQLWWIIGALLVTVVAGIMVRFSATRNLRGFILATSLVILGFYVGGCPCPIMSLHHVIFAVMGETPNWTGMLWFLGLIPVTYLFGKVWCGWVCHLGALQEFLFLPGKIKLLQSEKAQKVMRFIRIGLLVILIAQVLITRTNLFKTIDPFKVAFNLQAANLTGWILLGLLLLSSLFIYRPFCKTACPIGLLLGWVSKIPGASILSPQRECVGCKICDSSCKINAITNENKISALDNQECIVCGNCVGDCRKGAMLFVRNSKKYHSKAVCKNV